MSNNDDLADGYKDLCSRYAIVSIGRLFWFVVITLFFFLFSLFVKEQSHETSTFPQRESIPDQSWDQ